MDEQGRRLDPQTLEAARETISRQAEEIDRLRRELAARSLAGELTDGLRLAAIGGVIASPVTQDRLLELIVATAADVINVRAASLFLIDHETQELVFEVALGERAEAAKRLRMPLGHGVAGLVAATGQPMAIADADADSRDATDIAAAVGYSPKTILCVPLTYQDEVIGVLELLDKEDGATFSASDMEILGLFAHQAAAAIQQARVNDSLGALLTEVLGSASNSAPEVRRMLESRAIALADNIAGDMTYQRAIELARLVQDIAHRGEHELLACLAILEGFATYLRTQPQPSIDFGSLQW